MSESKNGAAHALSWVAPLIIWYQNNARSLPWRADRDPYHVWISEIMLQQTRIETVMPYYARFMNDYPTVEALAEAPLEDVLKHWEGLGYYSRAKNLHKAAGLIAEMGGFPQTYEEIRHLPGIGDYTAGAIAAIAFGLPETAVDGNVMRVVSRLQKLEEDVMLASSRKKVEELLKASYPKEAAGAFVQGLMELGEVICLPKGPKCEACPLQSYCEAKKAGLQEALPVRIPKTKRRIEDRAVVIVRNAMGEVLVFKRPDNVVLGGLYELPNVEISPEADLPSVLNAIRNQYGFTPEKLTFKQSAKHVFSHITWNMRVFEAYSEEAGKDGIWAEKNAVMLPTAFRKLQD